MSSEEIEQELAGWADEPSRRLASTGAYSLVRPDPLELEPDAAQATRKQPRYESDVAPEGGIEIRRIGPRFPAVRAADILVMDEELVEVGKPSDPTDAEATAADPT